VRRADRLFQIVQFLRGGRLVTAAKLGHKLEVSERTIYRDIADLQASGVPIDGAAGAGYILRAGHDLPPLMFTRAEIVALVAGARLVKAWGGSSMAAAAEEALIKISAVLPPEAQARMQRIAIHAPGYHMLGEERQRIDLFEAAIEDRRVMAFDYADDEAKATTRAIWPLDGPARNGCNLQSGKRQNPAGFLSHDGGGWLERRKGLDQFPIMMNHDPTRYRSKINS
jgi:predicted DNA-binding transcriptional regulator YafY